MKIHKGMTNLEIAELLRAVAAAYKLKGEQKSSKGRSASGRNRFRIIAYQRAADAVEHLSSETKDLWDDDKLKEVAGIGEGIAAHLDEIFKNGKSKHFAKVMEGFPSAMFDLMKVPGIGAKTAYSLSMKFKSKITASDPIGSLAKLAKEGEIEKLEGMGKDTQAAIQKSIKEVKGRKIRLLLPYATTIADEVVEWLKTSKYVKRADILGSLRRKASTVGDVDIAVSSNEPEKVLLHFTKFPSKTRVLEKGDRTATIIVSGNRQVDLMVQKPEGYGALLQHFTGSKHHNIALREYAQKRGRSLSEYGIKGKGKLKKYSKEEDFYQALGMEWIPPELRENMGEIEAAVRGAQGKLSGFPRLVELDDVKADFQIHSSFDIETSHDLGESSMKEVVKKANSLNYEYIAFTEHNPSKSRHSESQIIDLLKRKKEIVEKINYSINKQKARGVKKVFNSLEIDIMPDGKLPVPEKGMELLDFALVSIHSSFRQSRGEMTKRVLNAMEHPRVKIFAHPTARLLNKREGIELNWQQIFEYCAKNDKLLEINADPMRLDLPDVLVKEAVEKGVKLTIGTDAHHVDGMDNMIYGVSVARRGWASKAEIINTRDLKDFEGLLKS